MHFLYFLLNLTNQYLFIKFYFFLIINLLIEAIIYYLIVKYALFPIIDFQIIIKALNSHLFIINLSYLNSHYLILIIHFIFI